MLALNCNSHNVRIAQETPASFSGRRLIAPARHHNSFRRLSAQSQAANPITSTSAPEVVGDVMATTNVVTCSPDDSVDRALELLVQHKITGLPVVDGDNVVVGVVSDFDLLALDNWGRTSKSDIFPQTDTTWRAFKDVQAALAKGTGKRVLDVMTPKPIVVKLSTNINEATSILLSKKIRRLPVVDDAGKLLGLISRRDIVRLALKRRNAGVVSQSEMQQ